MSLEPSTNKRPTRVPAVDLKSHGRSKVSNGKDILPDCDGRSVIARRYRDIASAILVDQGGADLCSESRKQLVRRFAAAAVLAEQMEAALARGQEISITEHCLLASTMVRVANKIGVDRVPKEIEQDPAVAHYEAELARLDREDQAAAEEEGA